MASDIRVEPMPLCQVCDDEAPAHVANYMCDDCEEGFRLMCDVQASAHRIGRRTKAHRLSRFELCQACDDSPHGATHRCEDCSIGEQFMCSVQSSAHKADRRTKAHRVVALSSHLVSAAVGSPQPSAAFDDDVPQKESAGVSWYVL